MSAADLVRAAAQQAFTTDDGEPNPLMLEPPMSAAELEALQARLPCPIPADVRELLALCSGFTGGALDYLDFTGARSSFEHAEIFPHGHPIAADGYGNFWVVDLCADSLVWGPIYFACHDAPVILYQSPTLQDFLGEVFKLAEHPHKSLVDDVHEDRLFDVWGTNPGVKEHAECLESGDAELVRFALQLGPSFQFIDLRNAAVGFGFSWGRYGSKTVVKRHGSLPIFAYEKRQGLLAKLFGRSA